MRTQILIYALLGAIALLLGFGYFSEVERNSKLRAQLAGLQEEMQKTWQVKAQENATLAAQKRSTATSADLRALRSEVKALRQQTLTLSNSLAETEALRQPAVGLPELAPSSPERDGSPREASAPAATRATPTREQIEAHICLSHLDQISLAVDTWARANGGFAPTSLVQLQDLIAPMVLVCPAESPTSIASSWRTFDPRTISYLMRRPGALWDFGTQGGGPTPPYLHCRIHETVLMTRTRMVGIPNKWVPSW